MRHFKSIIGFVFILLVVVIPLNSQPPAGDDPPTTEKITPHKAPLCFHIAGIDLC